MAFCASSFGLQPIQHSVLAVARQYGTPFYMWTPTLWPPRPSICAVEDEVAAVSVSNHDSFPTMVERLNKGVASTKISLYLCYIKDFFDGKSRFWPKQLIHQTLRLLMLGVHAHKGYDTHFVCVSVCQESTHTVLTLCVCLSVKTLLTSFQVYMTRHTYLRVFRWFF